MWAVYNNQDSGQAFFIKKKSGLKKEIKP